MSQQPSGWYDDPSNADLLRYWDGVTWTHHTAPKKSPTAAQSTIGCAEPAAPGAATSEPTAPLPQPAGTSGYAGGSGAAGRPTGPAPYQQLPQQSSYRAAPSEAQWMHDVKRTVDGVPLASWGRRFAAWLIDGVILAVVGGTISWAATPGLRSAFQSMVNAATANDQTRLQQLQGELVGPSLQFGITLWIVVTIYCIAFWTTVAATPGKLALGMSVRRASEPGPLPVGAALLRRLVPLAGQFVSLLTFIDYLWPLWDDKRQALHDKVASTQVVMGRQPRRKD